MEGRATASIGDGGDTRQVGEKRIVNMKRQKDNEHVSQDISFLGNGGDMSCINQRLDSAGLSINMP